MNARLQRLHDALASRGCDPTSNPGSGGTARCPCPNHGKGRGDQNPSLSFGETSDGRAWVTCHAGCDPKDVLDSLGLMRADLNPPRHAEKSIVAAYPYQDEQGELLFEVVRYEPKAFKQRRPNGRGGYKWDLKGVRRVPYHLPQLLAAVAAKTQILVVEGEKDVHAAESRGLVATTSPGGAGKWLPEFSEYLRGAVVTVVADRDEPGRKHARAVAQALTGIAGSIRVVEAAEGKDLSDHLAAGRTVDELVLLAVEPETIQATANQLPLTDTGNAERLHAYAGEDMRYCFLWGKWLIWDGMRWRTDDLGHAMAVSKTVVRRIQMEAEGCPDSDLAKKLTKWAHKSESRGKRGAMVDLFTSEQGISITPDVLDRDPWLLNCENGTLDLRTCTLRPHDRADRITKLMPLSYDPDASCPLWKAFLERILPIESVRAFVQRMVGWSLTGDVSEQVLLFCYGLGANGKSTFLRVLLALLGTDYGIQAPPELLLEKQQRGHPTELADLFGVRVAVCVEMGPGRKLDEVLVKQLTGGDIVRARRMREDFWQFEPTHHLWIAANHKPVIHGTDEAMWRRLMMIPFTVTIPEEERDGQLLTKLRAELPGILAWAVRGCQEWQQLGLAAPDEVRAATKEYRADMDVIGDFIEATCVVEPNASVHAKALYHAFLTWAEANGENVLPQQDFGQRMVERGFQRRKRKGLKVYIGVTLRRHDGDQGGPGGPLPASIAESRPGRAAEVPQSERGGDFTAGCLESSPPSPQPEHGRSDEVVAAEACMERALGSGDEEGVRAARQRLEGCVGSALAQAVEDDIRRALTNGGEE